MEIDGMIVTQHCMYLMTLSCALKKVKIVNFMSCVFTTTIYIFFNKTTETGNRDTRLLFVPNAMYNSREKKKVIQPETTAYGKAEVILCVEARAGE